LPGAPLPGVDAPGTTAEAPPPKPTTPPRTDTLNSWQTWWHYNRWAHLEVNDALLAETGSGGFFLGHGERAQMAPLLRATENQIRDVVQPALTKGLAAGGHADFEIYALHALAKIRDVPLPEGVPAFAIVVRPFLRNANQFVSEKAVLSLGIRGEDAFLPWLASILADAREGRDLVGRSLIGDRLRTFAAYGLGLLGERTRQPAVRIGAYDALMQALASDKDEVQAASLLALGLVAMPNGEAFVEGGEMFRGKTRVDQVLAIQRFFEDETQSYLARSQAPNALARLLKGAPASLRGHVAYALLAASGPLTQTPREVQNAAILALGQIGTAGQDPIDQEIRSHLERVAYKSSGDRSTRYLAMIALADVASRKGGGDEPFAGLEPTRRLFQRSLKTSRGETLAWNALALGVLEEDAEARGEVASPESAKALAAALEKARSSEVAGALAIALGMVRDPEAAPILLARLRESGDNYVRGYLALSLGMIGAPGAIDPIRQLLSSSTSQPFVVENAAIALGLLGDQETGTRLYGVLERAANPRVQSSVASAMGWIRDPRPLGDLCAMLGDTRRNDTARAWTAVAIGRMCDKDRWPWVGRLSVNVLYEVALPALLEPIYETGLLDLP
jgi:HEAT repeat protein